MSYISKWTSEQTKYLIKNYKEKTYEEMSSVLNKTPKQIQSKVYILGLSKRSDDWWSDYQIEFIKTYYQSLTYKEIGEKIGKSKSAVQSKIRKLGLKKVSYSNIKRLMNEDYFKIIDDEHKAYWLGFISADGCITNYEPNVYGFKIALQESDSDFLQKFIDDIEGNFKTVHRTTKCNGKEYPTVDVSFKNKRFVENLLKYITFNKTNIIRIPKIDDNLMRHYLRGFSDGDGCFYCGNCSNRKSFEIVSNSPKMLEDIQFEFAKNNINSSIYKKKNGNYKLGIYNFKDIELLQSYLYDGATIFMERKYIKSQKILKLPSQ